MDSLYSDKGLVLQWLWHRAETHFSAARGLWEAFPLLFAFMVSVVVFVSGVAISPNASNLPAWAGVIIIALFALVLIYLFGFNVVGPPHAAVEKWTAERYEGLADLLLGGAISLVECDMNAKRIAEGYIAWRTRGDWRLFRDLRKAQKAGGGPVRFRIAGWPDTIRFVAGEISGPWEYLH